jgi:hypothetical protein
MLGTYTVATWLEQRVFVCSARTTHRQRYSRVPPEHHPLLVEVDPHRLPQGSRSPVSVEGRRLSDEPDETLAY